MEKIGIIGAMGSEVTLLQKRMADVKETAYAGRVFYEGTLGGKAAVLVCSGIGKVNSAMTAQLLIDRFGVSAVTNTGIAGGAGNAHVRDVVISTDITYHDMELRILALGYPNLEFFQADKALQQAAAAACEGHLRYHLGRIVTGDQFISSKEVKEEIVSRLHPLAVEMEGGSIAHVCTANAVPFVVIRCISDNADDEAEMSYDTFEQLAADDAAQVVERMLEGYGG
ncbi:MAG: 5'-methylthioadenosine/adenosylhomocysteine nucleosidase [Oscillospiraceae bacterium]|nr:5'-methylthioadenosine/adenosylhomocysteine nucleosidase [Oscillospiraceae bacterium]